MFKTHSRSAAELMKVPQPQGCHAGIENISTMASEEDAVADQSNMDDSRKISRERIRRITFSEKSSVDEPTTSFQGRRKSSMIGAPGYVSQLVESLEKEESETPFEDEVRVPIRKQSLEERRTSIKEVESDIKYYMKSVARMSVADVKPSIEKLPTITKEKLEEIKSISGPKTADKDPSSKWLPSELLDSQSKGNTERSWVGTYIVGKDYWDPESKDDDRKEDRKLKYEIDEKKPWFEMPAHKTSYKEEAAFLDMKTKSLNKLEALKGDMDKEFYLKRERLITEAHAREKSKPLIEWTDNFKANFQEVAKTSKFSQSGTHISMVDADKWLEKADILDHVKLTLIHTGLCFLASNGTRERGLSFTEFTHFLQMISCTTGIPLRDIIKRLEVCLRKAPSNA